VQAKQLAEKGQDDLAVSYLNRFLEESGTSKTDQVEALGLKAEILTRSGGGLGSLQEAVKLGERALRLATEGPKTQDLRREQIKRILTLAPFMPPQANESVDSQRGLYSTGDRLARELIEHGDKSAEALKFRGQMLEGLASGPNPNSELLDQAIGFYEQARKLDPSDSETCIRLAFLYRDRKDDPKRGEAVLEELVKTAPKSAPAWLALFRYQVGRGMKAEERGDLDEARQDFETARETLDETLKLDPKGLDTHLTAAEFELARNRPEAARRLLTALPEKERKDPRAQAMLGLSSLKQNRIDEAIGIWRQGLSASNGTDANLTWRLAYMLLSLGRLEEAHSLTEQFRRLSGGEEPSPRSQYLSALESLKKNRPSEAIPVLNSLRLKPGIDDDLSALIYMTLGQCYEAVRNEPAALEQYAKALDVDPDMPGPRLARIRLLRGRPDEVESELRRALRVQGDDAALLLELAQLEFGKQVRKPSDQRDWSDLETLMERIKAVAPGASGLLLLQANQLLLEGKQEEGQKLLEEATKIQKSDPQVWLARAELLSKTGKLDQAVLVLERAMAPENAGDQASLRIAHAQYLTLQGHGQQARQDLVRNLDLLPANQRPEVWRALGALYTAQRNPEEARKAFAQWAEMLPDDPQPHLFLMEQALAADDREAADEQVEALKKISGERGIYWRIARAEELLRPVPGENEKAKDGRLAEAGQIIEQVRTEAPQDRYAYLLQGQLLEARGQTEPAAAAYEEALRHDGGPAALTRLVSLYTELGRQSDIDRLRQQYGAEVPALDRALAEKALAKGEKDRAAELASKVAEGQPENVEARIWQAQVLSRIGRPEQAEATLQKLVESQPQALQARLALVALQVQQGKTDEARKAVEQIKAEVKDLKKPELTYAQCWRLVGDQKRADEAFEAALEKSPDDPEVVRALADYDEISGRPEKAEALLDKYLKAHPDQRWAGRALAVLLSNHPGDRASWRRAWDLAQAADSEQAKLSDERLTRGIVLARSSDPKDHDKARAILSGLVLDLPADYPSAAAARSVLVQIYQRAGQPEKAAPVAAIDALAPNASVQAVLRYIDILVSAKQTGEALRQIGRINGGLDLDLLKARVLKADGQGEKAAEVVRQAFADYKEESNGRVLARRVLDTATQVDPALGVEIAHEIAKKWPADLWLEASALTRQEGKAEEALTLFLEAVPKADEGDLSDLTRNALALVTSSGQSGPERLSQAEKVVEAALERQPDSPDLLTRAGYLRHFQGRYADEVALYRKALEKKPGNPDFLNNLAWALCEGLGQPKEALPYIDQAFQVAARGRPPVVPPQFFDTRGVIRTRLGDLDNAIDDLEIAARARPTGTVLAHLARAYHEAGQTAKFRDTVQKALDAKLTPESLEPNERKDLVPLIFESDKTAAK
jgi:tetratricopeptide (TPR) repeat protein